MSPRRSRGAAAVEFVLVLPVLILLLTGAIEWGWYLRHEVLVIHLARDAASSGALTPMSDGPATVAQARAWDAVVEARFDPADAQIDATLQNSVMGPVINLDVTVTYQPLLPWIPTPDRLAAHHSTLLENR